MEMEMEMDLNAVETVAAVRRDDSAASSALNAASTRVEASTPPPPHQQPAALAFTILSPDDGGGGTAAPQQFITRELFPVLPPRGSSGLSKPGAEQVAKMKSRRGPRSRSSQYRGVTFYRRTGRWESHIWDCGKQVYLGGFDTAHAAARAHDRAAIKFRGMGADINFSLGDYDEDMKQMKQLTKEEVVHLLRRRRQTSTAGFNSSRGSYNQYGGRWDAPRPRMGRHYFLGSTNCIYLGLLDSQIEAAREAVTNSDPSVYHGDETTRLDQLHTQPAGVDVDLNLSISQPTSPHGTKRDNTKPFGFGGLHLRHGAFIQTSALKRAKAATPPPPPIYTGEPVAGEPLRDILPRLTPADLSYQHQ